MSNLPERIKRKRINAYSIRTGYQSTKNDIPKTVLSLTQGEIVNYAARCLIRACSQQYTL